VAIIAADALDPIDLVDLLETAQPHSGLAVIAASPGAAGRWQLAVTATGDALLAPLGLAFRVTTNAETTTTLQAILADTATRDTDKPEEPGNGATNADAPGQTEPVEVESTPPPAATAPVVEVRVLGSVEITWPGDAPRNRVAELVAFLATHPSGVGGERARLALWPVTTDDERFGERSPATFHNLTSAARKALGPDHDGGPLLERGPANIFRLADTVACDWTTFQRLTAQARRQPDNATQLLGEALSLVRGRPFQDQPPGYAWVALERLDNEIEAAIADAALDLVDLSLVNDDLDTARWATRQGFLAVPHSEPLLRATMRTAAAAGDRAGIERAWKHAQDLAAGLGATGEPEPATIALYQELCTPQTAT
jgi:DNA-binding SARP family transcriptional activator